MQFKSVLELNSFLGQYIPFSVSKRINMVCDELEKISFETSMVCRQISLIFANRRFIKQDTAKNILKSAIISISDPEDPFALFSPQEIQSISYLIEFFYSNLDVFAKAISLFVNSQYYPYISSVLLPSLFNYYTTEEAAVFASSFYVFASYEMAALPFTLFSGPFMASSMVFCFADRLFCSVFSANENETPTCDELCLRIINFASKSLHLLPEPQLNLIRHLIQTWSLKDVWLYLIHALLIPQIRIRVITSPINYSNLKTIKLDDIDKNLNYMSVNGKITCMISNVDQSSLITSIPKTFIKNGMSFHLRMTLSIFDIRTLFLIPLIFPAHLQSLCDFIKETDIPLTTVFSLRVFMSNPRLQKLPSPLVFGIPRLTYTKNQELGSMWERLNERSQRYQWDTVKTLTKKERTGDSLFDSVVSSSYLGELVSYGICLETEKLYKNAIDFEDLMTKCLERDCFSNWKTICKTYLDLVSAASVYNENPKIEKTNSQKILNTIYENVYSWPDLGYSRMWLALLYFNSAESIIISAEKAFIKNLENRFQKLLDKLKDEYTSGIHWTSKTLENKMWKLSGIILKVDSASSFLSRYISLFSFVEGIERLASALPGTNISEKVRYLIHFCIVVYDARWTLKTALFLQAVAFGDERFTSICSEAVQEMWKRFTVTFFHLISKDNSLLNDYANLATKGYIRTK